MKQLLKDKVIKTLLVWILYSIWLLYFSSITLSIGNFIIHLLFLISIITIYYSDLKEYFQSFLKNRKKIFLSVLLYSLIILVISTLIGNLIIKLITCLTSINFNADGGTNTILKLIDIIPNGTLFVFFLTVIFFPIIEELIFRKSLRDVIKNPIIFVIVSSLITWYFQSTIVSPKIPEFIMSIPLFLYSIFASILFLKKENILYIIFSRMIYNLIIFGVQFAIIFIK